MAYIHSNPEEIFYTIGPAIAIIIVFFVLAMSAASPSPAAPPAAKQGIAYWFVKKVKSKICPFCRAYEKVYNRKPHEPVLEQLK